MKFKHIFPYLCLGLLLSSQFIYGLDLTHHSHAAWLYNKMIIEQRFIAQDPYLLGGEQLTFTYGIIIYPITGLLWFIFQTFTVDIVMFILSILVFIILKKLIKKEWIVGVLTLSMLFNTVGDTLVFYFSNVLFYFGILLYYKKIRFWQVPIVIACINHPLTLIPSIYFVLKDSKLFAVFGTIVSYFIIISLFFSQTSKIPIYLPLVFIVRVLLLIIPIVLIEDVFTKFYEVIYSLHKKVISSTDIKIIKKVSKQIVKHSKKNISSIKKFVNLKIPLPYVIFLIGFVCFLTATITLSFTGANYRTYFISTTELFDNFPNITGNMRVIDYLWLPSLMFSNDNITFSDGSFRENNNINFASNYWTNESYYNFILDKSFDYILVCKLCNPPTNEFDILNDNFELFWENEYYYLYEI